MKIKFTLDEGAYAPEKAHAGLVIQPIADCELVEVESLDQTERGDNGFGSTGR